MAKREFLMKAKNFDPDRYSIGGWYMSEKIDARRAWWDGGITRGMPKHKVPWANLDRDIHKSMSTGLWSPYGNTIQAPDWWLDKLPRMPIDGELSKYDRGLEARREVMSATKKMEPIDDEWEDIFLRAFDSPPYEAVLGTGTISNPQFRKRLSWAINQNFIPDDLEYRAFPNTVFRYRYNALCNRYEHVVDHFPLPFKATEAAAEYEAMYRSILDAGGEGIMLHDPDKFYLGERVHHVLKNKPVNDAEGVMVGWISGKRGVGTKFVGMMGALVIKLANGEELELSGFTNQERNIGDFETGEGQRHNTSTPVFKLGEQITFKYREISPDGIPIEARYYRKRDES